MIRKTYLGASAFAALAMSLLFTACSKQGDIVEPRSKTSATAVLSAQNLQGGGCGSPEVLDLYAGQHILAGSITVSNTDTELHITVETSGDWQISQTHLYVGDAADMPTTPASGNPMVGLFPHSDTHSPAVTSFSYSIPLANLDSCFAIALHADVQRVENGQVVQAETAWGDGERFTDAGSWATYYSYCVQSCCQIQPQSYTVYGGQTIETGDLLVTNDNDNLYVTWQMGACWELRETHLYVGDAASIPSTGQGTPIPGQFPMQATHNAGTDSYTYTIPLASLPACYAVAAHASVVGSCPSNTGAQETAWSYGTEFSSPRWGWYSEYCTQNCGN